MATQPYIDSDSLYNRASQYSPGRYANAPFVPGGALTLNELLAGSNGNIGSYMANYSKYDPNNLTGNLKLSPIDRPFSFAGNPAPGVFRAPAAAAAAPAAAAPAAAAPAAAAPAAAAPAAAAPAAAGFFSRVGSALGIPIGGLKGLGLGMGVQMANHMVPHLDEHGGQYLPSAANNLRDTAVNLGSGFLMGGPAGAVINGGFDILKNASKLIRPVVNRATDEYYGPASNAAGIANIAGNALVGGLPGAAAAAFNPFGPASKGQEMDRDIDARLAEMKARQEKGFRASQTAPKVPAPKAPAPAAPAPKPEPAPQRPEGAYGNQGPNAYVPPTREELARFRRETGTRFEPTSINDKLSLERMRAGEETFNTKQANAYRKAHPNYRPGMYAKG